MASRKSSRRRYTKDWAEERLLRAVKDLKDSLKGSMNSVISNKLREIAKDVGRR